MRRLHARLAAACALAVAMAVLTSGSAFAGGGDHGNSANAPGQQKQEQAQPAPQQQSQPAQQPPAQEQGVKPSSTTKHWTHTQVGSSPDVSKRYGNGKTAAQIAKSKGAPDNAVLTGPGNSQPHKISDCRHKSNKSGGVDVHAYKGSASCETETSHAQKPVETKHEESKPEEHKVTLCHATGSSTNPYVMITVDYHALKEGHTAAKGDIIPPTTINGVTYSGNWDAAGQAIFNNGCKPVAAAQAPVTTTTTQATTTVETTTVATTTQAQLPVTTTVTTPSTVTETVNTTETTTTPQLTQSTGGVLGAATSLASPKKKAHGGVLGTVTNVAGSTLPFTGFPVWLAVLVAIALILAGIALRRRTLGARL